MRSIFCTKRFVRKGWNILEKKFSFSFLNFLRSDMFFSFSCDGILKIPSIDYISELKL